MTIELIEGDSREVLRELEDNSIDSCVTDPPYALTSIVKRFGGKSAAPAQYGRDGAYARASAGFMGKKWDTGDTAFDPAFWGEVWRVLKPGAHLLAFGGTRTYHRLAVAIEDAGFEIRDQVGWVFGSGFPKSHNQSGDWEGYGTALKPAWEPICLARKPLDGTVAGNLAKWGVGALNIAGCRVPTDENLGGGAYAKDATERDGSWQNTDRSGGQGSGFSNGGAGDYAQPAGRWPANLIHDGSDEVVSVFPAQAGAAAPVRKRNADKLRNTYGAFKGSIDEQGSTFQGDSGSAARFFYCAKASRADRNDGLAGFEKKPLLWSSGTQNPGSFQAEGTDKSAQNNHPTVKPTELMRYLCRLITPPGGTVLDPFMGSGSTGRGAVLEGFSFIGIEMEAEYFDIADARIAAVEPKHVEAAE